MNINNNENPENLPAGIVIRGYRFFLDSHPISISLMGLITMIAIYLMERRNITRFRIMIDRGKELEFLMFLQGGKFNRLGERGDIGFITYTGSLTAIYSVIGGMWLYLLTLNFFTLYQRNFP